MDSKTSCQPDHHLHVWRRPETMVNTPIPDGRLRFSDLAPNSVFTCEIEDSNGKIIFHQKDRRALATEKIEHVSGWSNTSRPSVAMS